MMLPISPTASRAVMCTLVATLALSGCRRRVPDQPVPVVQLPESVGPAPDSVDRDAARRDSIAREERLRAERERMAAARATLQEPVYFDYDRADLSAEAKRALDAKRTLLAASADVMLRIAGHADERGSDEYNVALGQRRAVAAKRYLVDHGIDPGRLDVVSFGEERPVCTVSAESCWRRNRRAEFEITAGFGPVAGH